MGYGLTLWITRQAIELAGNINIVIIAIICLHLLFSTGIIHFVIKQPVDGGFGKMRTEKRQPIVVGDKFKSINGLVWIVSEDMKFGRGYWVVSSDRCRQAVFNRHDLETMERV